MGNCLFGNELSHLDHLKNNYQHDVIEHRQRARANKTERADNRENRLKTLKPVYGEIRDPSRINEYMFLGDIWNARDEKMLKRLNIKYIVNVSRFENSFEGQGIQYVNVELDDDPSEKIYLHFPDIIKFIDKVRVNYEHNLFGRDYKLKNFSSTYNIFDFQENYSLEDEKDVSEQEQEESHPGNVLVHCEFGVSRSATAVIAYLIYCTGNSVDDTIQFVKERRDVINPNNGFIAQLKAYEKDMKNALDGRRS